MADVIVPIAPARMVEIAAELAAATGADIHEWRMDATNIPVTDPNSYVRFASALLASTEIPILATFRSAREGGPKEIGIEDYVTLIRAIAETGVWAVDVEVFAGSHSRAGSGTANTGATSSHSVTLDTRIVNTITEISAGGTRVIGSWHDFTGTPPLNEILARFEAMIAAGITYPKIAVVPRSRSDIGALIYATSLIAEHNGVHPIGISMGPLGLVSRVFADDIGSWATFAAGSRASAPGQPTIRDLAAILASIERAKGA